MIIQKIKSSTITSIRLRLLADLIRHLPPIPLLTYGRIAVYAHINYKNYVRIVASLYSYYYQSKAKSPCLITHDGSLTSYDITMLQSLFPGIYVCQENIQLLTLTKRYPLTDSYYRSNSSIRQLCNALLIRKFEAIIIISENTIFFEDPIDIRTWTGKYSIYLCNNTYLGLCPNEVTPPKIAAVKIFIDRIAKHANPRFNTGLLCVVLADVSFDTIETTLKYIHTVGMNFLALDQYVWAAIFSSLQRSQNLSKNYIHVCEIHEIQHYSASSLPTMIHFHESSVPLYCKYAIPYFKTLVNR